MYSWVFNSIQKEKNKENNVKQTKRILTIASLTLATAGLGWAQAGSPPPLPPTPDSGFQFIKVHMYTEEEDAALLKLYDGLRESDVIDALDAVGLKEVTMMDQRIRPLWRDEQHMTHRIHGVAVTVHVVPAQAGEPQFNNEADALKWQGVNGGLPADAGRWQPPADQQINNGPRAGSGWQMEIHKGSVLVLQDEAKDNGFCGSNNGATMMGQGLVGMVGDAGVCRDTDEMVLTHIPVYQDPARSPRGINQGREWLESYNSPVVVGGVLVMPGDVIVADYDGVAVVPRAKAVQVARIARWIFEDDEYKRGKIYDKNGWPRDWTVQGHQTPPSPDGVPIPNDSIPKK
jgi:regulator of RNase E activity RraA